jgi:uncharacterized protein (TIGR02147 family)
LCYYGGCSILRFMENTNLETLIQATAKNDNYRAFLQRELVERCKKNPQYSLRAFSKNLGVAPSLMSRVLNGERKISQKFLMQTASALNLLPQDISNIFKNKNQKDSLTKASLSFQTLALEHLEAISDWVHYALFELIETDDFKSNSKWMAKRLGVSHYEVEMALARLEKLQIIICDSKGRYQKLKEHIATTDHSFSTLAFRNLQKQFLNMAARALDEVPMNLRDQTTMTMAIDASRIEEAKVKIKKFRYEMLEFLQSTEKINEVYGLTIGLFPITRSPAQKLILKNKKQGDQK